MLRRQDGRSCPVQALIPLERFRIPQEKLRLSVTSTRHNLLAQEIFHKVVPLGECKVRDGLLFIHGLLYVPDGETRLQILRSCHEPSGGHPGRAATYKLVSRDYWWPKMRLTIGYLHKNQTSASCSLWVAKTT